MAADDYPQDGWDDWDDCDDHRKCFECETTQHESMGDSCDTCDEWICNGCRDQHNESQQHIDMLRGLDEK